jgi:hypothetical protein
MNIDNVVMDMTGVGQGFHDEVRREVGRGYTGFNFSDKESVEEMMGDMNFALHNDLVYLPDSTKMKEQMGAIVKQQTYEDSKPRFSGKKHAPEGKDDLAMATIMGAFPPNFKGDRSQELQQRGEVSADSGDDEESDNSLNQDGFTGVKISESSDSNGYSLSKKRTGSKNKSRYSRKDTSRRRQRI